MKAYLLSQYLLMTLVSSGVYAASSTPAGNASKDEPVKTLSAARVISCAVKFPLDSVRFSREQVSNCLKTTNIKNISYIHVIATATADGSGKHNLYLSTRRAGAIEAYLNNEYPEIQVHAFGGGENPKFGKVARIFIVENAAPSHDIAQGVQLAAAGPPEVIEKITTRTVTKEVYVPNPERGIEVYGFTGAGRFADDPSPYSMEGFQLSKNVKLPYVRHLDVGIRRLSLQSDERLDIHSTSLTAKRTWNLRNVTNTNIAFEQMLSGGLLEANKNHAEFAAISALVFSQKYAQVRFGIAKSNYLSQGFLGLGVRL